ncbi:MAG: hypothetical protein KGS72_04100 [Cyanobacteria bacterium REEB67]|nr:hypothetical protein [Cyanobacteria bacterium REEB67]
MDMIISRMMRLLGVLNVVGFVVGGIHCADGKDWPSCLFYLCYGVVSAGIFTVIWAVAGSNMQELLKNHKREDYTNTSAIGLSVGVLALFTCIGFVCAGLTATWTNDIFYALWFHALGTLTTGALAIIWCVTDYNFVSAAKN